MPLPSTYTSARIVVQSESLRYFELVTWWTCDFALTPPVDLSYADSLAEQIDDNVNGPLSQCLPVDWTYIGVATRLNDSGVIWSGRYVDHQGPGLVASDGLPDFNACVVRKFAGVPGRTGMGRWYVPGVCETLTATNSLTGPGMTKYNALADALTTDLLVNGDTWHACHHSKKDATIVKIVDTQVDFYLGRLSRREVRPLI